MLWRRPCEDMFVPCLLLCSLSGQIFQILSWYSGLKSKQKQVIRALVCLSALIGWENRVILTQNYYPRHACKYRKYKCAPWRKRTITAGIFCGKVQLVKFMNRLRPLIGDIKISNHGFRYSITLHSILGRELFRILVIYFMKLTN